MECSSCHAQLPPGSKFCNQCGATVLVPCASCGHVNPPGSKFCTQCGGKLVPGGAEPSSPAPPNDDFGTVASAERRHLTVMFCDLVGSTALSARLDVEDLREIIGAYQRRVAEVVNRFGGFVARYMGDGVLVYFGYPHAHEDDPEEAARAGLALVDAIGEMQEAERLQVRIGIATGLAVVGDLVRTGGSSEREIIGEMPNLAARLQALAEPNTIVIADSTRRLVGSVFELEDLGPQVLKGFAEPQRIWRVLGESSVQSRFEALRSVATPLIAREEEFEVLHRRWEQAKAGAGRVVLVSAEPGVGKSRLIVALQERLGAEPHIALRFFCSPHLQGSVLSPVIVQLERAAGFQRGDSPEEKLDKLEALLAAAPASPQEIALVAELLLLPTTRYPAVDFTPQGKKDRMFEALLRHLDAVATHRPCVMIFEDLQWIDPTSRELLDLTIGRVDTWPVLLIASFRPEFAAPWIGQPHVTTLTLNRFSRRDSEALVRQVAGEPGLPSEIFQEIVDRADGVPLFLEEVTKAVLEVGGGARARGLLAKVPSSSALVPPTLQASLMARLDRLGLAAKEVAQVGATIGREFSYELLAIVAQRSDADLQASLNRVREAGLVFQQGSPPRANYHFKHALVQEAAYGTLLRGPRQKLHARIAEALQNTFPDIVEGRPEVVARHLSEAGLIGSAAVYWNRAGELALRRSAVREAMTHFSTALHMIDGLSEGPERNRRELNTRLGLGTALNIARGSAHPDVAGNYSRAIELGRGLGDSKELFRALWGSWYTTQVTGRCEQALGLGAELVELAERLGDPDLMLEAYHSRWASSHTLGLNAATLADTERGMALYEPGRHHVHAYDYGGHDTGVCARAHSAVTLWLTGFPDRAERMSVAALELGGRLNHPPSLAHAAWWSAALRQLLRQPEPCRELAELAVRIAREQGSEIFVMCPLLIGWSVFRAGESGEGLRLMEQAVESSRRWTRRFYYDYELLVFAEALLESGAPDRALETAEEAIEFIEGSGNRLFEAEACRLKGQSLAAFGAGRLVEAETWMKNAVKTAAQQGALSLQLRAATGFARLCRDQGRHKEARDLLRPIYDAFTEGYGTADLCDARALLSEIDTAESGRLSPLHSPEPRPT